MSGGGGGIIIRQTVRKSLSEPLVHGALPAQIVQILDPVLGKDPSTWGEIDCLIAGHAMDWALMNLK